MILTSISIVFTAVLSWIVVNWILLRADRLRLIQVPNHRSSHSKPTPTGGGLGIVVAGTLSGAGLTAFSQWQIGWIVLGLAAMLAALGLRDDIKPVPAKMRFLIQVLICLGLLSAIGQPQLLAVHIDLKLSVIGWALLAFLLLSNVWWINLFNFMDGIDGIAGSQAVFMLLVGAMLAYAVDPAVISKPVWQMMLLISAATIGFLMMNWPPAKIFMGDVGSTWLAFIVFALILLSVQAEWLSYTSWLVLAATFVTDSTVTLITRLLRHERWYEAHRSHAYQRLTRHWQLDRKVGHRNVTALFITVNMLWLAPLAWACLQWTEFSMALAVIAYLPLVVAAIWLGAGKPDQELLNTGV